MAGFLVLDKQITQWLARILPHNLFMDWVWQFFSGFGFSLLIWIMVGLVVLYFYEVKYRKFFLVCLMGLLLVNGAVYGLKYSVRRARPTAIKSDPYSFPSAHAANAFYFAAFLSGYGLAKCKRKKHEKHPLVMQFSQPIFLYGLAVLVCYSRVYLGAHFLSDVGVGAIIGFIVAQFILRLRLWVLHKI